MMPFDRLFHPMKLGRQEAKNRIWMTGHATLLVKDHLFTDEHIAYYVERAKGGVGVITMEAMATHPTTQPYKGKAFAFDPRMIPQFQRIARAVRPHGAKILSQPWHRGRQTNSVSNGLPVWAPSAVPCGIYREMPHVMSQEDIDELVEGYRLCARHSVEGELDGVEVHGMAHGYLLGQFLSPATNHRTDRYGGSLENRMRIVMEILRATREETGPGPIVGVRLNSDDGMDGGLGPQEWADIARRLEATGLIDYISCSQGTYLNRMMIYPTSPEDHGFQLPATRIVKQAVGLPVVGVGRITTPEEAERFLEEGACDFIGLSRALIADPMWGKKARSGRSHTVRPCVGANWCMESIFAQAPIACIHNPAAGAERHLGEGTLRPATEAKKVAVVGGGPAGLQAALTAALRGHDVTLFERNGAVGGQVEWWSRTAIRSELRTIIKFLSDRLAETGARVELGRSVGERDLEGFDSIVVATGSKPLRHGWSPLRPKMWDGSQLPGADGAGVFTLEDILAGPELPERLGHDVTIYDTLGGRQGVVVADHLAEKGHAVTFVTTLGQGAPNLAASRDWGKVYGRLRGMGVRFVADHELVSIEPGSARLRDLFTGEEHEQEATSVVLVLGSRAEDGLYHSLKNDGGFAGSVRMIGDCVSPRRVSDAIREAELAARAI